MSSTQPAAAPKPGDDAHRVALGELRADRRRLAVRLGAAAVLVGIVVAFVVRNSQAVRVDFLVASRHPRLIWVILVCFLVGVAVGLLAGSPGRLRKRREGRRHH